MACVAYKCTSCKKTATFETEGATMFMMDDNVPRPPTYVSIAQIAARKNSVTVKKNE